MTHKEALTIVEREMRATFSHADFTRLEMANEISEAFNMVFNAETIVVSEENSNWKIEG